MNKCPVCKGNAGTRPQEWSGGRMVVECTNCGKYEIAPWIYDELLPLSDTDWRIELLRSGIANTPEPRMIRKLPASIAAVATIGTDKPTKLQKRFLRARAEGKIAGVGTIFHADGADDESDS